MPATKDRSAFSPVTKSIHHHGKDPEAPAPNSIDELESEVGRVGSDLLEASGVLATLAEHRNDSLTPFLWSLSGLAERASNRLNDAADALYGGHTQNVGYRLEDVGTMALHLRHALRLAWETAEQNDVSEMESGAFAVASNAADYTSERLDHLVYEADLPID